MKIFKSHCSYRAVALHNTISDSNLTIPPQESKGLTAPLQIRKEVADAILGGRGLEIEVEAHIEVPSLNGAVLQLGEVNPLGGELGQGSVQGAGLVGQSQHEADLGGPGVDPQVLGDADEAGIVAPRVHVGAPISELGEAVEGGAGLRGDGGHVIPTHSGHGGGGLGGIATDVGFDLGVSL